MVAAANVTVGGTNAESIYELLGFGVEVGGGGGYIFGGTGAVVRGHDKFWNEKHTERMGGVYIRVKRCFSDNERGF